MPAYPYVLTIASEKGGVGKTTLATNLAVYLQALDESRPVTVLSLDNHFTVDRMFAFQPAKPGAPGVADFLAGRPLADCREFGQYGVHFLRSAADLPLQRTLGDPFHLARLLAAHPDPGLVIIDTRPDLGILTQNALFAADRTLIPVKDLASLDNCKNIFQLFDRHGLERKSLGLVPCLVDARIKYTDPLFTDQKALIKGFAINRGFRCYDVAISKSPKVESLATNPAARVLPVLTSARGTEVHLQLTRLATMVAAELAGLTAPRAGQFAAWLADQAATRARAAARLDTRCLVCGQPEASGYLLTSSADEAPRFAERSCLISLLARGVYGVADPLALDLVGAMLGQGACLLAGDPPVFSSHGADGRILSQRPCAAPALLAPLLRGEGGLILLPVPAGGPPASLEPAFVRRLQRLRSQLAATPRQEAPC